MSSTNVSSSGTISADTGQHQLSEDQQSGNQISVVGEQTSPGNNPAWPGRLSKIVPGSVQQSFENQFELLSEIIKRTFLPFINAEEVVLHTTNGDIWVPADDDSRFSIIAWSTPKKQYWTNLVTNSLLGYNDPVVIRCFESVSEEQFLIRVKPEGPAIAEVIGPRIYIIANIFDLPQKQLEATFAFILGQALEIFISTSLISAETLLTAAQSFPDSTSLACLEFPGDAQQLLLEAEIKKLSSELEQVKKLLELENHTIYRCSHTLHTEEKMLLTKGSGACGQNTSQCIPLADVPFTDWAQIEFDFIISHPLVRYLPHGIPEIRSQKSNGDSERTDHIEQPIESFQFLSVYTKHITTRHRTSNDLYDMGYYRFKVPIERAAHFQWYNLTRRVTAYGSEPKNHPHIFGDGHACLGNAERMLQESLVSGKLYETVQLGIRFLTSCHINDPAGMTLTSWPLYE